MNKFYLVLLFLAKVLLSFEPYEYPFDFSITKLFNDGEDNYFHDDNPALNTELSVDNFLSNYPNQLQNEPLDEHLIPKEVIDVDKIGDVKVKPKPKKTIQKHRNKTRDWTKMTKQIFKKMFEYEKKHPFVRRDELEDKFNVNRTTYWRWKKKYGYI